MSLIFKTFEEAREYIKRDPIGKSLVRLDDDSGYEVKSKNEKPTESPPSLVDNDNEVLSVEDLKELIGNIPEVKKKTIVDKSKLEIYKTPVSTRVRKKRWSYPAKKKHVKKTVLSTPPVLKPKTVQPLQTRTQNAQGRISSSKYLDGKRNTHSPKPVNKYPKQYIDEPLGTREDSKKMYGRQGAINRSNKN
jgi:hypothetical protein